MVEDGGKASLTSPVLVAMEPSVAPMDKFMGNFGETLRQEREFRGITLDAITRITKISNRHLVALEQEHFEVLPGGVFNKSMVREYARVVGLDQDEWVGRYLSAHQPTGPAADEDGWMRFAENASKARGPSRGYRPDQTLRWTGIGVLLLLVAGLSWFVWSYVHKKISLGPAPQAIRVTASLRPEGHDWGMPHRVLPPAGSFPA